MKKKNLFIILAICLIGLFACIAETRSFAGDENTIPIIIGEGDFGGSPIIRSPGSVPIEAAYYPSLSFILVNFDYDLGSISVKIECLTTGAYSQVLLNATQGVHPFLISGDTGIYEITFTLSDGHTYIGSFEIE